MTIADQLNGVGEVKRDRWGRPLITPPGGGKPVAYTRCTTFIKALEDAWALQGWSKRRVARGLANRADLLLAVGSLPDEYATGLTDAERKRAKKDLDDICEEAMQAAGSSAKATIGTALHKIAERMDRGEKFDIPAVAQEDIFAYRRATAGFRHYCIEELTVNDDLKVAGTADRVLLVDGEPVIGDIKTGSITHGLGTIAMQLAIYARSERYNVETGERLPLTVNTDRGLIIHLPAGEARCELVWVDLNAGWAAVQLAAAVREWRGRKDIATPYEGSGASPSVLDRIRAAATPEALSALWQECREDWTDEWTEAAKVRKAELQGVTK